MGKIKKEKFNISGYHGKERTTFSAQVELMLCYHGDHHYFYFETEEMKKYFSPEHHDKIQINFHHCDTRNKAIETFQLVMDECSKKTKMLRIELGMPSRLYNMDNPKYNKESFEQPTIIKTDFPEYLQEMLKRTSVQGAGLTIDFKRVMKIESNGICMYSDCNAKWNYPKYQLHGGWGANLIEWSEEREMFLLTTQAKMDMLCANVLNFFNAPDLKEFYKRMETSNTFRLLGGEEK